ncbi:DUF2846 domain-containing protein [Undibacterium danionis]|uniref:DUF2846 domain-containing protein n=1 Tax=Undibacterium danionis TaxID=1812100 RepID=A0ABV6IAM4_9BURK
MARLFRFFTTITVLSAGLLTGCASVQMAPSNEDAQAKNFTVNPQSAKLYIYRNEFMGQSIKMPVELDGKEIGKTISKSFLVATVAPGKHSLLSKAENDSSLEIDTEAGKNYYIWQEIKMGFLSARSKLQLVDAAQGQAGVRESKLIDTGTNPAKATNAANGNNASTAGTTPITNQAVSTTATATPLSTTNGDMKIEKVPFELGVSSITVERMAKQNSCQSEKGAGLLYKKGPVEMYRIACEDGRELKVRCELRQCQFFTP